MEQATPEEQRRYEELHDAMIMIVDEPRVFDSFIESIRQAAQAGQLVQQVAQATVAILDRLEQQEGQVEDVYLMQLGEDIIDYIAARMEEAEIDQVSPQQAEQMLSRAVALWMETHQDRVQTDPGEVEQAQAAMMAEQREPIQRGAMGQAADMERQGLLGSA